MSACRRSPGSLIGPPPPPPALPSDDPAIADVPSAVVELTTACGQLDEILIEQVRAVVDAARGVDDLAADELADGIRRRISEAAALDENLTAQIAGFMQSALMAPVQQLRDLGDEIVTPWDFPPAVGSILPPVPGVGSAISGNGLLGAPAARPSPGPISRMPLVPGRTVQRPFRPPIRPPGRPGQPQPALVPPATPGTAPPGGVIPGGPGFTCPPGQHWIQTPGWPNVCGFDGEPAPPVGTVPVLPGEPAPAPPSEQPLPPAEPMPVVATCCFPRMTIYSDNSWSLEFNLTDYPELAGLIPTMVDLVEETWPTSESEALTGTEDQPGSKIIDDSWSE